MVIIRSKHDVLVRLQLEVKGDTEHAAHTKANVNLKLPLELTKNKV